MDKLVFLGWFLCMLTSIWVGAKKGEPIEGLIYGTLFGPVGLLLMVFSKGNRKICQSCRELIDPEASVCKHCRSAIERSCPIKCPYCRVSGEIRESLLSEKVECPKCNKMFTPRDALTR